MGLILTPALEAERLKRITVRWSYPRQLNGLWYDERIYSGSGLYYISRKLGKKEALLYIGKTNDNYYSRLADHYYNWLGEIRGRIFIRLGSIEYPAHKSNDELKTIADDAERVLIYAMQPPYNSKATISYLPNHLYAVENTGYRGELYPTISMRDHIE